MGEAWRLGLWSGWLLMAGRLLREPRFFVEPRRKHVGRKRHATQFRQMCTSKLFLHRSIWAEILQPAVRSNGKNAGRRLQMRPSRMHGKNNVECQQVGLLVRSIIYRPFGRLDLIR